MADALETVHATAIAFGDKAALLRGPSGSGKSDLALRCLMQPPTALFKDQVTLIADDRVALEKKGGDLFASPPPQIAGLIEVRGLGLYRLPYSQNVRVTKIFDLVDQGQIERLPQTTAQTQLLGISLPVIRIWAFEASATHKLMLAFSDMPRPEVEE